MWYIGIISDGQLIAVPVQYVEVKDDARSEGELKYESAISQAREGVQNDKQPGYEPEELSIRTEIGNIF